MLQIIFEQLHCATIKFGGRGVYVDRKRPKVEVPPCSGGVAQGGCRVTTLTKINIYQVFIGRSYINLTYLLKNEGKKLAGYFNTDEE